MRDKFRRSAKRMPPECLDLFLAVADLCDGGWEDADRRIVTKAYNRLLKTPMGAQAYAEAVDAGMRLLEGE